MKILRLLIGPLFWIIATWMTINYAPGMIAKAQGKNPPSDIAKNNSGEISLKNVLGESESENENKNGIKLPNPPKSVQQIPDYVKEIIRETTHQIVQTGSTTIQQTTENVAGNVCQQIMMEIQKQCSSAPTP